MILKTTAMRKKLKITCTVSIDVSDPDIPDLEAKLKNLELLGESTYAFCESTRRLLANILKCPQLIDKSTFPDLLYFRGYCQDSTDETSS